MAQATRQPVQARALKTRAALLHAAEQEFAAGGYAGTTAKSIAVRAGAATGTFYQYFTDKDAALRELARSRSEALADRLGAALLGGERQQVGDAYVPPIAAVIAEVVAYHRHDVGLHAVLTERRHVDAELDAITSASEKRFVDDIESHLRHWGYTGDRRALAFVIFAMVEGAVHGHVLGIKVVSDKRLTAALSDAVVTLVAAGLPAGKGAA